MADPVVDMLMLMDGMCIGTDGNAAIISKMIIAKGGKELPKDVQAQDPALVRDGGTAFRLKVNGRSYAIAVTGKGGCSVLSDQVPAKALRAELLKLYPLQVTSEDASGFQVSTEYRFKRGTRYEGAGLALVVAKSGYGADGAVVLSFAPRRLLD